ncbi:XRE family transcriptional regulator [Virgibacillus halodenitrificans]|uniref:helix-turn-helix domain-containing protein n=1 Tax=Virgibacillus halodenitrificans TaxID=1482 RepID=UPI001FB2167F|nr:XRE family transcriptional regulator [Virgibacillus halodenitrificans]MCJ0930007.1 XRE family transcriptional regulator [Virgibacillus halodenitrificans]
MFDEKKIKNLRVAQNLSLKQLSEKSGVSVSMISQIERNKTDPTLTTLYKICKGLGVSISSFLEKDDQSAHIIRKNQRKTLLFPQSHTKYELLTPVTDGNIEMIKIHLEPGQDDKQLVVHEGEECGHVLRGEMTVILRDEEYILQEGDTIRFNSNTPHRFLNHTEETAVSVWAMTGRIV